MTSDPDGASPEPEATDHEFEDSMIDTKDSNPFKLESSASSVRVNGQSKLNSKDPSRPRRKKARRACFACQRAHLTCGDERPCQRCIKRGLQDNCQDGIRKKAKYLHDTPPDALISPSVGGTYNMTAITSPSNPPPQPHNPMMFSSAAMSNMYYQDARNIGVNLYPQTSASQIYQVPRSPGQEPFISIAPTSSSNCFTTSTTHSSSMPVPQASITNHCMQPYSLDPNDPALFNFDISDLNFGNQYGALEFSMLGHLSSGANEMHTGLPEILDPAQPVPMQSYDNSGPMSGPSPRSFAFGQEELMCTHRIDRHVCPPPNLALEPPHTTSAIHDVDRLEARPGPYAYAIRARPSSLASASPQSTAPDTPAETARLSSVITSVQTTSAVYPQNPSGHHHPVQHPHQNAPDAARHPHSSILLPSRKNSLDGDSLYDNVKQPYPYTAGFHRLFNYIKTNFCKDNVVRIAQALAAVRPALISFAQGLTEKDLIFMEQCVQRRLYAYESYIEAYGTPTIIARRDGAIIAVSQGFVVLTGWDKDILLGKKPNLNINTSASPKSASIREEHDEQGGQQTNLNSDPINGNAFDSADLASSRTQEDKTNGIAAVALPKNLLLAEVMSQETVVEFYEDYATLAFSDPMGKAIRRGSLLKYRAQENIDNAQSTSRGIKMNTGKRLNSSTVNGMSKVKIEDGALATDNCNIAGESAFGRLGEKEGFIDCMYCWSLRRDNFEVPQLIVMNVSQIYCLKSVLKSDWSKSRFCLSSNTLLNNEE